MTDNSVSTYECDVRERLKDAETFGKVEDNEVLLIEIGVLRGLIRDIEMWREIGRREVDLIPPEDKQTMVHVAYLTDQIERLRKALKQVVTHDVASVITRLETEITQLHEVIRDDITKWSFDALVMMAKHILEDVYPEKIFTGKLHVKDSGVRFVVTLRQLITEIEKT